MVTAMKRSVTSVLCAGAVAALATSVGAQTVDIGSATGSCGSQVTISITISGVTDMNSFGMDMTFDDSCLDYVRVEKGSGTQDWSLVQGSIQQDGSLRIGGAPFGGSTITGSAEVARVVFTCNAQACPCNSTLSATNLVDFIAGATVNNGTVECQEGGDDITLLNEYTFDSDAEGWTANAFAPTYLAPYQTTAPGYLLQASASDADVTFGFFGSPADALTMVDFDPMADGSQTGELWERQGPHYLVRYYMRRTTADVSKAINYRVRVNSEDFQDNRQLIVGSYNNNEMVPDLYESEAIDFLFQPSPLMYDLAEAQQRYSLSFDVLNNPPSADDPNGGYLLDRVEIYTIPLSKIQEVDNVVTFDLTTSGDQAKWESVNYTPTYKPVTFGTGSSGLEMSAADVDGTFGNWQSINGEIEADVTGEQGTLFIRTRSLVQSDEPDATEVPELRVRNQSATFTQVSETDVFDSGIGDMVPSLDNDRYLYTYLKLPEGTTTYSLQSAWDYLSFEATPNTSDLPVYLSEHRVDVIRVMDYPAATANP